MKLVFNRTTREDNDENQITNINYGQNSMSVYKKSNSHQIKHEHNKFTYTSLEKIRDLSSI